VNNQLVYQIFIKKRFNPVNIPPKQTIEEHHTDEESVPIQNIDRRREPPVQVRSTDDEESLRAQDVDRRREPPVQVRSTDDEESLRAQDVDRRRERPVQVRSSDDEESLRAQDVDRRREPPVQGRSIDYEESLRAQDVDRRREPPVQGRSIDYEESLRAQEIDRRREPVVQERSIAEYDSNEVITTDVSRPSRTFEESSFPSTTITSTLHYSSSHEDHDKRSFKDEFSTTTIESSTEFNRRAIRPIITETSNESQEEIQILTRNLSENNIETTTNVKSSSFVKSESYTPEPLSSVDSFGKITGLLPDSSNEESTTTQSSLNNQQIVTTISVSPGKIIEPKIYSNQPSKTNIVTEHVQQLSQGQKQPVVETKKSN